MNPIASRHDIDRGISIPRRTHESRYPFDDMSIGDSFFAAGDKKMRDRVRASVQHRSETRGEKYVTRKKPNGVRVWRVK